MCVDTFGISEHERTAKRAALLYHHPSVRSMEELRDVRGENGSMKCRMIGHRKRSMYFLCGSILEILLRERDTKCDVTKRGLGADKIEQLNYKRRCRDFILFLYIEINFSTMKYFATLLQKE